MSLTSYRAAPPRVVLRSAVSCVVVSCVMHCRIAEYGVRLRVAVRRVGADGVVAWDAPTFCCVVRCHVVRGWLGGSGGDRLSRALRHSIMGAGGFHVRVRDGIGCCPAAMATRPSQPTPRNVFVGAFRVMPAWRGSGSGVCECVLMRGFAWQWVAAVHGGPRSGFCALWRLVLGWDEPFGRLGPVG